MDYRQNENLNCSMAYGFRKIISVRARNSCGILGIGFERMTARGNEQRARFDFTFETICISPISGARVREHSNGVR